MNKRYIKNYKSEEAKIKRFSEYDIMVILVLYANNISIARISKFVNNHNYRIV